MLETITCPGTGQAVGAGSTCRDCGQSFGYPHAANLVVGMPAPKHEKTITVCWKCGFEVTDNGCDCA